MSERHTNGALQHWREITETGATRSGLARASDTRPFKPYVWRGDTAEPPAVTAARERHRALNAAMDRRLDELEARQALETGDDWQASEARAWAQAADAAGGPS